VCDLIDDLDLDWEELEELPTLEYYQLLLGAIEMYANPFSRFLGEGSDWHYDRRPRRSRRIIRYDDDEESEEFEE